MLRALAEGLGLLSLLMILIGTSNSEAYYASFGLRYQFLPIASDHVLYRGLTAPMNSIWAALLVGVAIACVAGQGALASQPILRRQMRVANLVVVLFLAGFAWVVGSFTGKWSAIDDRSTRSALPRVVQLALQGQQDPIIASASEGYRLLFQTSIGIYVFRELSDSTSQAPVIRFFSGGQVVQLAICGVC